MKNSERRNIVSRGKGWLGEIKAIGTERHAYAGIAKAVPIPNAAYGWAAPFRDQGQTPQCGPYSFCEVFYAERIRNGLEPVLLDPQDLANSYAKETGEPFDGVYNRLMLAVATKYGVLCKKDGKRYFISGYHQVDLANEDEVFNCLAERRSFLAGFPVYEKAFEDAENGVTTFPQKGDRYLGGHDCSFNGYIRKSKNPIYGKKSILFGQNHWADWGFGPNNSPGWEGDAFAEEGHFMMPLDFLVKYGADAWTISL